MNYLKSCLTIFSFSVCFSAGFSQSIPLYRDANQPIDRRIKNLLSQLSLKEKVSLLGYQSEAVPRLGIPAYNWWNEGLHGVARAGQATIFPQAIAMAATFNDSLVYEIGDAISTEARAKYNLALNHNRHLQYMGLTFWSPNINIFRDPRWGRGQETYGEDPYLTSRMGTAYVKGMQGNDPKYLKVSATAKHFVAHSGPEGNRDYFNSVVDEKDLRETYLPAFKALVDAGVESVMSAYNRVNGVPNSVNKMLLTDILRKEWGFKGHVVTDCGALDDVFNTHKTLAGPVETAAAALKAGINLDCSTVLQGDLLKAIDRKLISEKEIDAALYSLLKTQFKLGFFDKPEALPFHSFNADSIHNNAHVNLTRKAAQQSMVLLKNSDNILPFAPGKYSSYMVLGPNAASFDAIAGNYHGVTDKAVNFVEGITAAVDKGTRVEYDLGADYRDTTHFGGIWAAGNADVTIAIIGLTPVLEGEAGDAFLSETGGDKKNLELPAGHIAFMKALRKSVKKPIIAVITAGSDVDIAAIEPYADAIVLAWYPGEQGGNALADILFGKVSPSGRLPITFYQSIKNLPDYQSYSMSGRTYRYYDKPVQYPFGFGLSYTSFNYNFLVKPKDRYNQKDSIAFTVTVKNTGKIDGDEVVQAYIKYPKGDRMPVKELKAFKRISVTAGTEKNIALKIAPKDLMKWDLKNHRWKLYPGNYQLVVGANSRDENLTSSFVIQ